MLIRAWTREKVSLRSEKCLYSTHRRRNRPRQRPPDDNDSRKRKDKRTGTAILFFKKKTRRRRYVKARYFNKKRRANALYKNAYLYRGKIWINFKNFVSKLCRFPIFIAFSNVLRRSGPWGHGFKSRHSDQKSSNLFCKLELFSYIRLTTSYITSWLYALRAWYLPFGQVVDEYNITASLPCNITLRSKISLQVNLAISLYNVACSSYTIFGG